MLSVRDVEQSPVQVGGPHVRRTVEGTAALCHASGPFFVLQLAEQFHCGR